MKKWTAARANATVATRASARPSARPTVRGTPISRRSFLDAALLLSATASGCISLSVLREAPAQYYAPAAPAGDRLGQSAAQVRVVEVTSASRSVVVDADVDFAPGVAGEVAQVGGVRLSVEGAPPCSAGVAASSVLLDGVPRWDRPIGVAGIHAMTFVFDDAVGLLADRAVVLDIRVSRPKGGGDGCLRLHLGSRDSPRPWKLAPRAWSVGGVLRGGFSLNHNLVQLIDDEVRISYWVDRLVVGAEAGWRAQTCEGRCGQNPTFAIPLWLFAETIPIRVRELGVGIAVAYGVAYGLNRRSDWNSSGPQQVVHGPRLALHLLRLTPPVWGTPILAARGLELSLAYQHSLLGPPAPSVILGFGVVAF